MTSVIDMSLEDIIQRKRKENPRAKTNGLTKGKMKKNAPPTKQIPVTDARNKIISKKRKQIIDAREKLGELAKQKDARLKLEALRKKRALIQLHTQGRRGLIPPHIAGRNFLQSHGKLARGIPRNEIVFGDPSRQVVSQPMSRGRVQAKQPITTRKFLESRSIANRSLESRSIPKRSLESRSFANRSLDSKPVRSLETRSYANRSLENRSMTSRSLASRSLVSDRHTSRMKPIMRTVENDLEIIDDDPMEDDYTSSRPSMLNRKANLQLRIIAHNHDASAATRRSTSHRLSTPEEERSPPRPQSILKKRPMAALRTENKTEKSDKPALEYRIIVSNLRNSVTGGDIEELFGDVGGMVESRLVRAGTAEVIYKTMEDAQRAVELYHNRQLDGQPMNCLLVTPRAPQLQPPKRIGNKPALYSTNSNVEPDISTFHKVLFSSF